MNIPICVANIVSINIHKHKNSLVNIFIYMAIDFETIVGSSSGHNICIRTKVEDLPILHKKHVKM